MPYGIYLSAAGADVQAKRLEVLSNNLANVSTPGFKRELAILQARHAEAIDQGLATAGAGGIDDVGGGVTLAETVTDFSSGTLRETGVESDVAINGEGFFLLDHDGEQLLTRAGNFHFDTQGMLRSEQGFAVLSTTNEPIAINPNLPWRMLNDGTVVQGGDRLSLAIVQPQHVSDLAKAGQNTFRPLAATSPVTERRVAAGYLEQSTVVPAREMMELIETSRAYEANVRMIQHHDQALGQLVGRILRA